MLLTDESDCNEPLPMHKPETKEVNRHESEMMNFGKRDY